VKYQKRGKKENAHLSLNSFTLTLINYLKAVNLLDLRIKVLTTALKVNMLIVSHNPVRMRPQKAKPLW